MIHSPMLRLSMAHSLQVIDLIQSSVKNSINLLNYKLLEFIKPDREKIFEIN